MKYIILEWIWILFLGLYGCQPVLSETRQLNESQINLTLEDTEDIATDKEADFARGDLLTMFEEMNNEPIVHFLYSDYNKDGLHEAFVLTEGTEGNNLWYMDAKNCEKIAEGLENIEQLETDILTFQTKDYLLLQQMTEDTRQTLIYSVDNSNHVMEASISKKGYVTKTVSGDIWLQERPQTGEEENVENWNTYYLYYVYDEGFKEYGAIPIGKEQFLEFEGAQEILAEVEEQYPEYTIEYSFLYRANHYININVTLLKEGGVIYKNLLVVYDDYAVKKASEQMRDGKMEIANMLEIATFPTAFKHPKKEIQEENGG